ncbi:hypothetical protein E2C01_097528 [Portunus trituberculatus]|uniref:Uncharacterized protein n=1 Tax=Portunus trituberculatus TaxID=210409 RepID=A0A5B7KBM5_PORTR|nr:hypothetical protein [Portunus trituberculatus]
MTPAVPSLKAWGLIRSTLWGTSGPPRPRTPQTCGRHTLPRRMSELPLLLLPPLHSFQIFYRLKILTFSESLTCFKLQALMESMFLLFCITYFC